MMKGINKFRYVRSVNRSFEPPGRRILNNGSLLKTIFFLTAYQTLVASDYPPELAGSYHV